MRRGTWTTGLLAAMLALLLRRERSGESGRRRHDPRSQARDPEPVAPPLPQRWAAARDGDPARPLRPGEGLPIASPAAGPRQHLQDLDEQRPGRRGRHPQGLRCDHGHARGGDGWYTDWWNDGKRGDPRGRATSSTRCSRSSSTTTGSAPTALARPRRHLDGRPRRGLPRWAPAGLLRIGRDHVGPRRHWRPTTASRSRCRRCRPPTAGWRRRIPRPSTGPTVASTRTGTTRSSSPSTTARRGST